MAAFPEYDVDDLADFTGRPEATFPGYVDEALSQAAFFIRLRTEIVEWPDDPDMQRLLKYAILELGNNLYLEREYDRIKANPLQSETIGSYSYSKSNAAQAALYTARPTGLMWLDVLLERMRAIDVEALPSYGSTQVFENDDVWLVNGQRRVLGPQDRPERQYNRNQTRRSNPYWGYSGEFPGDIP